MWEENKKLLLLFGRKIHKTLKSALLLWEENTQNFKKVLCYCGKKMHKT